MNALTDRQPRPTPSRVAVAWIAVLALTAALALALAHAPGARAAAELCATTGSAAGQCADPVGVAVNEESGDIYVAEQGNLRVSVFEEGGEFAFAFGWGVDTGAAELETCTTASGCQKGIEGSGAGQFGRFLNRIAIDNSGGPDQGAVYTGTENARVQRFEPDGEFAFAFGWGVDTGAAELETCTTASGCQAGMPGPAECQISRSNSPLAVGPGGNVFVADSSGSEPNFTARAQKYSPAGACLGETVIFEGNKVLIALAVDSSEDLYVANSRLEAGLRKFEWATATELCAPPGLDPEAVTNGLAIGPGDHVFAAQREAPAFSGPVHHVISEYGPACAKVRRFGYDQIGANMVGLADHGGKGGLFGVEQVFGGDGRVSLIAIPPPGPIMVPSSLEVASLGVVKGEIRAEVNSEGKETEVLVEYVDEESYEEEAFEGPNTKVSEPETLAGGFEVGGVEIPIGCEDHEAEPEECLEPETTYRYRVVAKSDDNPTGEGEGTAEAEDPFTTPPHLQALWVRGVGTDTATLAVSIDALGLPTTAYFEYVSETSFESSGFDDAVKIPDPATEAPLDFGEGEGAQTRVVALYPLGEGTTYRYRVVIADPLSESVSAPNSFTTFAPPEREPCPNDGARAGLSEPLPDCRAYEMVSPLDKEEGEIVVRPEAFTNLPATLDQAAVSGEKVAYGSYRAFGDAVSAPYTSQYIAQRGGGGWASHAIAPALDELLKGPVFDNEYRLFSEDLCQAWLTPPAETREDYGQLKGAPNLFRREDRLCGSETYSPLITGQSTPAPYTLEVEGASADGMVVAFGANRALEGSGAPANPTNFQQLYVKGPGGNPRFACVRADGTPSSGGCAAGTNTVGGFGKGRLGSFTNALSEDGSRLYWTDAVGDGPIYLRENPLGAGGECEGGGSPCTVAISAVGEEEAGTGSSHFWAATADGSAAVYTTGTLVGGDASLYEFSAEGKETSLIAGETYGLVGASEDLARVYFASGEVLDSEANKEGESAVKGEPNLYLREAGEGGGSYRFIARLAAADVNPTPNLRSSSATALEPTRRSSRVSPDGAHAALLSAASLTGYDNTDAKSGKADTEAFVYDAVADELICASCNPSGGRPEGENAAGEGIPFWIAARLPVYESTLYGSRALAEDGSRLYFEAADSLAARDTNGKIDVYQWEEEGKGGCEATDAGFVPEAEGCVDLISSGQSDRDSAFLDASPSGSDVFFTTLQSLYPADYGLVDVYDARVGGGFPAPPPAEVECEAEECQSPTSAPEFPTPGSSSYKGPSSSSEAEARRCANGKAKRFANRAKRLRRASKRVNGLRKKRRLRQKAARNAKRAKRLSRKAKRCRRANRRAR